MATFNIYPGDQCIRELINTRAFEYESATEIASSIAVLKQLKCAVCSRLVVEDFNWCQPGETIPHSICGPCINVHKEEKALKTLPTCPIIIKVEQDEAVSCEKKLAGFENGVLRYMDNFLSMWRFPCGAERYGCTFVGTKEEIRAHEVSQCLYKYLRVCSITKLNGNTGEQLCGKVFNSHLELSQHLETHGIKQQHLDESTHVLAFKDINDLTEEWVVIDRRLVGCPNGRFCTLMVCENKTEIRLWLQEIKSKEDDARGVKSQLYFAKTPAGDSEFPQYCYQTRILPWDMTVLADVGFETFEIKKKFLRRSADYQLDGNINFNVKFQFFDSFSSAASPNSTDAEIETPSTQSVNKQKGSFDDAVQPDNVDKSIAAKRLLAANDADGNSCVANVGDSQVPVFKQNKLDTVIEPTVQKKPDAVVQPAVQKKPNAEPNPFDGGFQPVRTWPMEEPSTGGSQAQPTEPKLPPHPKDGWKSYTRKKFKDVRCHGGAESKDFKGKTNAGEESSHTSERKRSQGYTKQPGSTWKSKRNKDSGEISIAGGFQVGRQETFPPADVRNTVATKEEKGDNASAETKPHSPFRVPLSTETAMDLSIGGQTRGRNYQQVRSNVPTTSDANRQRWMPKSKNQYKDSSQ